MKQKKNFILYARKAQQYVLSVREGDVIFSQSLLIDESSIVLLLSAESVYK